MANVRQQNRVAGARERRTALLYAMSRELAGTRGSDSMARVAVRHIAEVFDASAVVLTPDTHGAAIPVRQAPRQFVPRGRSPGGAVGLRSWPARRSRHRHAAGRACRLPAARRYTTDARSARRAADQPAAHPLPEQRHLLETFAGQIALAWERAALGEEAAASRVAAESESLRNTLLASISHDLRTPLAVIVGAASTLARHGTALEPSAQQALALAIEEQAHEMSNLISNVLDLMRLESGRVELRCDTHAVEDLVGAALNRLEPRLHDHPITIDLPDELPVVSVDAVLVSQVLANLLDNAVKYTPTGTRNPHSRGRRRADGQGRGRGRRTGFAPR